MIWLLAAACTDPSASPAGGDLPTVDAEPDGGGCDTSGLALCPEHGFYDAPFDVSITIEHAPEATIRYTLDGSDPRTSAATLPYLGPIRIDPSSPDGRLIHDALAPAVVVRAVAFLETTPIVPPVTATYIFPEAVLSQADTSGGAGYGSTAMAPEVVADYGQALVEALTAIPTLSLVLDPLHLFGEDGVYTTDAEHPTSVELLDPRAGRDFQVDCGIQKSGDHRENKQSLTLRFRSEYGPKVLEYPLFGDATVDEFDVLRLRTSGQDKWIGSGNPSAQFLRDEYGRRSQSAMGWDAAIGDTFHLYLNGVYWGLYDVLERPDEDYAAIHFGGDEEDYDWVKDRTGLGAGTIDAWDAMNAVTGLQDPAQYEQIQQLLDVTAFADYTLLQMWGGNTDWPGRNWIALRKSRNRDADDIQFRFFVWDFDATLGLVTVDLSATNGVLNLQDKLRDNADYAAMFTERARQHLGSPGGALTAEVASTRYRDLADRIEPAIPLEAARWGGQISGFTPLELVDEWHTERDRLLEEWFPQRTDAVLDQLGVIP